MALHAAQLKWNLAHTSGEGWSAKRSADGSTVTVTNPDGVSSTFGGKRAACAYVWIYCGANLWNYGGLADSNRRVNFYGMAVRHITVEAA